MRHIPFRTIIRRVFQAIRRWLSLALISWVASRISRELALAIYIEALKAGWYDAAR